MTGPGAESLVGGEAADVGVPEHGADGLDRTALDGAVMDAPAGVFAEIGAEQSGSDEMAGMALDRQRQRRQRRQQQRHVVVGEAAVLIGGEGIDDAGAMRAVAVFAKSVESAEIIGAAVAEKLLEHRKIALLRAFHEAPAHPGIVLAGDRPLDQVLEGAGQPDQLMIGAMGVMLGLDRIEIAPPGVAIAAPLRMQRLHRRMRAPQRHAVDDEALAEAVEQLIGGGAAQALAHRPDMRLDDLMAERIVEALERERKLGRGARIGIHEKTFCCRFRLAFVASGAAIRGSAEASSIIWGGSRKSVSRC